MLDRWFDEVGGSGLGCQETFNFPNCFLQTGHSTVLLKVSQLGLSLSMPNSAIGQIPTASFDFDSGRRFDEKISSSHSTSEMNFSLTLRCASDLKYWRVLTESTPGGQHAWRR